MKMLRNIGQLEREKIFTFICAGSEQRKTQTTTYREMLNSSMKKNSNLTVMGLFGILTERREKKAHKV